MSVVGAPDHTQQIGTQGQRLFTIGHQKGRDLLEAGRALDELECHQTGNAPVNADLPSAKLSLRSHGHAALLLLSSFPCSGFPRGIFPARQFFQPVISFAGGLW